MAISPADRANQSERLNQTREEADEKEAKALKRKNEQLKRAEHRHQQEVSKLTNAYQNELGNIREKQKATMNEREKDHQQDLSKVRKIYSGNLQNKIESGAQDKKILKDTYEGEIDKQKYVSKSQRENLLQKQERELAKRDESLAVVTIDAREKMKEAMDDSSRRLKEAHEKEVNLLRNHADNDRMQSELDKGQMRKAYEGQKMATARQGESRDLLWKQKYEDLNAQVNEIQESGQTAQGQMLTEGLKNIKTKYDQRLNKKAEQLDKNNEMFRESVSERVNSQVRSKDSKIQLLGAKLNNHVINDKRMREMERTNLQSVYEDKLHDVENQRDQTKEVMQELNKKRIDGMKEKNDSVLRRANQDYRSQMDVERTRFRENLQTTEQLKDNEVNRISNRAEGRVDKLQKLSELNAKRLGDYYDDNIDMAREGFERKVMDQRDRNMELQGQNNRMMSDRFRKIENTYAKKLETAVNTYELKLQELKDNHDKEIRRLEGTSKLRMEDKEKGHRTERDSTEMKYEAKLAMMEKEHQERLQTVQSRHQEELRDLAMKMNQYNKKA